jgi:hypothetical protein
MLTRAVYFVESVSRALFLICGLGLLFTIRALVLARRELSHAEYALDRELAQYRQANAITLFFAMVEIFLAIVAITFVVAPTLRNDVALNVTPTVVGQGPFQTSTPPSGTDAGNIVLTANAKINSSGPVIVPSSTNAPTAVGTILPDVPKAIGCETADAALQIPANGQVLFDSLTVVGTANTANFAYYKFEISGAPTGNNFAPIGGQKTTPVTTIGTLGQLALGTLPRGNYQFRLTVFDSSNTLKASCAVHIILQDRPTPTLAPSPGILPGG